jgi:glutamate-1-semialdehyde 2,1-aminomutase
MMTDEFAQGMRQLCDETGTVLIYDEVITGFRHGLGGYQEKVGIVPDLTTMGKAMSNGYPCAAIGGKQELMNHFLAAGGTVYFSGTLNAHPLGTVATAATIAELEDPRTYQHLFALGDHLRDGFRQISERLGIPMVVAGYGSISVPYFRDPELGPPRNYADLLSCDAEMDVAFRSAMVERGMLIYPRPGARLVLTAAHTLSDVDKMLEAAEDVLRDLQ